MQYCNSICLICYDVKSVFTPNKSRIIEYDYLCYYFNICFFFNLKHIYIYKYKTPEWNKKKMFFLVLTLRGPQKTLNKILKFLLKLCKFCSLVSFVLALSIFWYIDFYTLSSFLKSYIFFFSFEADFVFMKIDCFYSNRKTLFDFIHSNNMGEF